MSATPSDTTAGRLKPGFNPPRETGFVGMLLFLAALFMLFAAGLVGYVLMRVRAPANVSIHFPALLWASTMTLLAVSVSVHLALKAVQQERQADFRRWLGLLIAAAAGFLILQTPALWNILSTHFAVEATGTHLYGLVFFLILVHALHVVGGIAWLAVISIHGFSGGYDHEHYQPVRLAALYWHFLDVVWVVMFLSFQLLG